MADLTAADYEEVLADHRRLVRELDEALSGPGNAAKQASLCDLIPQAKAMREALRLNSDALRKALTGGNVKAHEAAEALKQAAKWFR
jgi:hypothetical protein